MSKFIIKRFLGLLVTILGLSILMFILSRLMPGDAIRYALGPNATEAQVLQMEEQLGLNLSYPQQYWNYLTGFLTGDMGMSLRTNRNVALDIIDTFPATFELAIIATILSVVIGIPLGILSATHYNQLPDFLIRIFSMTGIAIPEFFLAIVLQIIFGYMLGWLPIIGRGPGPETTVTGLFLLDSLITLDWEALWISFKHIILPSITLAIAPMAQIMRMTRNNMLSRKNKDYILAARAYGLPKDIVENRYLLKNSITSLLTIIGMQFGSLIGNAFLVETVFSWPGMAQYSINGLVANDYNSIISVTLIVGIMFALVNLIVDIMYGYFDPRIKVG
ncbi:ABC transporter permease [Fundicoccus culcitae]|uniref:ABC transporter permease n=1 Tax=Fundicoccus culcitae TaxID=2969821 RepID=A0ABY5P4V5_9LACT|nr:ABC transporter permease [Fundicoccus culcitae]UUX33515.1 ABC transporter permease [Fundicoccus culcitae]